MQASINHAENARRMQPQRTKRPSKKWSEEFSRGEHRANGNRHRSRMSRGKRNRIIPSSRNGFPSRVSLSKRTPRLIWFAYSVDICVHGSAVGCSSDRDERRIRGGYRATLKWKIYPDYGICIDFIRRLCFSVKAHHRRGDSRNDFCMNMNEGGSRR